MVPPVTGHLSLYDAQLDCVIAGFTHCIPLSASSLRVWVLRWPLQVVLGGGQDAASVTTTSSRQGKFEAVFYHKVSMPRA